MDGDLQYISINFHKVGRVEAEVVTTLYVYFTFQGSKGGMMHTEGPVE